MLKRTILSVFSLWVGCVCFGQTIITNENMAQTLETLFQQAQKAQFTADFQPSRQASTFSVLQTTSVQNPLDFSVSKNSPKLPIEKTWQIAVIYSAFRNFIQADIAQVKSQVARGHVSQGVILDIAPLVGSSAKKGKDNKTKRKTGTLYFIYPSAQGPVVTAKAVDGLVDVDKLLKTFLVNLQKYQHNHYNMLYLDTHGTPWSVNINGQSLNGEKLAKTLNEIHYRVNVLFLGGCNNSSLYNAFFLSQSGKVDQLIASSNSAVPLPLVLSDMMLLHPGQFVVSMLESQIENISRPKTNTTDLISLDLRRLKQPLQKYLENYWELLSYNETGPEIEKKFKSLVPEKKSLYALTSVLEKQITYIKQRKEQDKANGYEALVASEMEFLLAATNLIQALNYRGQICYSAKYHKLFYRNLPKDSGCLSPLNVDEDQFYAPYLTE